MFDLLNFKIRAFFLGHKLARKSKRVNAMIDQFEKCVNSSENLASTRDFFYDIVDEIAIISTTIANSYFNKLIHEAKGELKTSPKVNTAGYIVSSWLNDTFKIETRLNNAFLRFMNGLCIRGDYSVLHRPFSVEKYEEFNKTINEGTAEAQAIINLIPNVKDAEVNKLINVRIATRLDVYIAKVNDLFTSHDMKGEMIDARDCVFLHIDYVKFQNKYNDCMIKYYDSIVKLCNAEEGN